MLTRLDIFLPTLNVNGGGKNELNSTIGEKRWWLEVKRRYRTSVRVIVNINVFNDTDLVILYSN